MKHLRRTIAGAMAVFLSSAVVLGSAPSAKAARGLIKIPASMPHVGGSISLNAEIFRPTGTGPFPAIVLMHGCGGWQSAVRHSLRQHAKFMSSKGYVVLSLDSFGPRGNTGGTVCESFRRLREAREYRSYDAFDALRYLQAQTFVDAERVFLVGQSNGGSVALKVAEDGATGRYGRGGPGFRGVVALYPWCGALGTVRPTLAAPLLILGGGRDDWVPPDDCQRFRASGASLDVKVYPTAAHSFDVLAPLQRYLGKLIGFDRQATEDGRRQMLAFFKRAAAGNAAFPVQRSATSPSLAGEAREIHSGDQETVSLR